MRKHFRFHAECFLEFTVIDLRIARNNDKYRIASDAERQRFCDTARLATERCRRKLHRCARRFKLAHAIGYAER